LTDEAAVRGALDTVIDPCSRAAGAPAGLVELGVVRSVAVRTGDDGERVRVVLGLTDPTCVMGPTFVESAHEAVRALPGVCAVEVAFEEDSTAWSPQDMTPAYRRRLSVLRQKGV
jgi:metal-sulfur cluster biosynthetic enzyme